MQREIAGGGCSFEANKMLETVKFFFNGVFSNPNYQTTSGVPCVGRYSSPLTLITDACTAFHIGDSSDVQLLIQSILELYSKSRQSRRITLPILHARHP